MEADVLFKKKTAYEMRISDWSSDVCSSELRIDRPRLVALGNVARDRGGQARHADLDDAVVAEQVVEGGAEMAARFHHQATQAPPSTTSRTEDHWPEPWQALGVPKPRVPTRGDSPPHPIPQIRHDHPPSRPTHHTLRTAP